MFFDAHGLNTQLDDLRRRLNGGEVGWAKEDLRLLTLEICEQVSRILNLRAVDDALNRDAAVDAAALRGAVNLLKSVPIEDYEMPNAPTFDAQKRFETLDNIVSSAENAAALSSLELALRLEMIGDGQFDGMLIALRNHDDVRQKLRDVVREKLSFLPDADAIDLLARYERETDPAREVHIPLDAEILEKDSFRVGSADEARDRCADYVVRSRPILERRMLSAGSTYLPGGFVGIAKILSWTSTPNLNFTRAQRRLVLCVARIVVCWGAALGESDRRELATAFGITADGYLCSGRGFTQAKTALGETRPSLAGLVEELVTLTRLASAQSTTSPLEDALHAYRAGIEVMGPEMRLELIKHHETKLQRHATRFLIERGHHVAGTTYGPYQIDLRGTDGAGALLVEVKKWKGSGAPSERTLRSWFAQLHRYMSMEPLRSRGALLIYNFGRIPIVAAEGYMHARYIVVPINLCAQIPSRTDESVVLEESPDPSDFILVRRNARATKGSSPLRQRRRRKKSRSEKK